MFIDIHTHLETYSDEKIKEIIGRARKANVGIIVNNSVNPEVNRKTLELAEKYPEIKCALGIYPIDSINLTKSQIENEIEFIRRNRERIIAIGEVGIDLKESADFEIQKENFIRFIFLANELNLPIIIHSRYAEEKVIEILEENSKVDVIMHCFNGNLKLVERVIKNGWYLSIPGIVSFSEHFFKVVEQCPLSQMFCETDTPFLHPIRGKRDNEPANVVFSYKKIAEIKKLDLKMVEEKIEKNFIKVF